MKKVTKGEFFAVIGPLDVHPSHEKPDITQWKTRAGQIVGHSLPGWKNGYVNGQLIPAEYFLV